MAVNITTSESKVTVKINLPRVEGQNSIYTALVNEKKLPITVSKIEFDMQRVTYINSMGLAEFIAIYRYLTTHSRQEFTMSFFNLSPNIARMFRLIELGELAELQEQQS